MLFNSLFFIFVFLPLSLVGFFLIGSRGHHRVATAWLVTCSLFFYGWWNPAYLGLILVSMLFNYAMGVQLSMRAFSLLKKKLLLAFAVSSNLALLGYYKYANFFVDNLNLFLDTGFTLEKIILPLAISFFTFQQIAYVVDAYKGETREYNFLHYCLFVTFFPQLIAGPIVHHREMMPQFAKDETYRFNARSFIFGITIFSIGLFKKVVLADDIAGYVNPVFSLAEQLTPISTVDAWVATLGYSLQLYFDFSGYADMAIGIGLMFGVLLPINFNSPFLSININDFWRRWHITLGRFFREYLYIPLGGSRKGFLVTQLNIFIVMLLSGLWHGAGWTFVFWGVLHGLAMVINGVWRQFRVSACRHDLTQSTFVGRLLSILITFVFVVLAFVYFRAETITGANHILARLFSETIWSEIQAVYSSGYNNALSRIAFLMAIVFLIPNVARIYVAKCRLSDPSMIHAIFSSLLFACSLYVLLYKANVIHEFLYFNF